MLTRFLSAIVAAGIGFAAAVGPARAADDIEAKAQPCAACHGANGNPVDAKTIPIIWGQEQSYLMKQLRDFRNGERKSAIMSPIAKELAEGDLRPLAAYFSGKTWPARRAAAKPPSAPKGLAQCQACHQPKFEGGPPAPRLAGLSYEYLISQMHAFATEERSNNLDMPRFMRMLGESERRTIARYLSAL
jgi:cytochrome c553